MISIADLIGASPGNRARARRRHCRFLDPLYDKTRADYRSRAAERGIALRTPTHRLDTRKRDAA